MWKGPGATPAMSGYPADWEREPTNPIAHSWEESGREMPLGNGAWRAAKPPADHLRWNGELPPALKVLVPEWETHMEQFYLNRGAGFVAGAVPTRVWQHPGDSGVAASPLPYCVRSGDPWFAPRREEAAGFEKRAMEYKAKWRVRDRAERADALAARAASEAPLNEAINQNEDVRIRAFYESRGWRSFEQYGDDELEEWIGGEGIPGGYDLPLLQHFGFRPPAEGGWAAVGRGEAKPEVVNNGLRITYPDEPSDYQELHPPSLPLLEWLERWGRIMSDADLQLAQSAVLEEDVRGVQRSTSSERSRRTADEARAAEAKAAEQEEVLDIGGDDDDDEEEDTFGILLEASPDAPPEVLEEVLAADDDDDDDDDEEEEEGEYEDEAKGR